MANEPQNPQNPVEDGPGTSIEKFKTSEERDRAYLELEKFSKTQAREMAEMKQRMEQWESQYAQPAPQDNRSFTDLYPSQQQYQQQVQGIDQREQELASRLLTRPSEVLRQLRQEANRDAMALVTNLDAINRFKADNPDLAKHDELVGVYVRRQPENLPPHERLRRAAPEVRKYLQSIAKSGHQQPIELDPDSYIEAPTQRAAPPAPPPAPPSEEDELTELIRERTAIAAKKRL
jgi:hypothetical protein